MVDIELPHPVRRQRKPTHGHNDPPISCRKAVWLKDTTVKQPALRKRKEPPAAARRHGLGDHFAGANGGGRDDVNPTSQLPGDWRLLLLFVEPSPVSICKFVRNVFLDFPSDIRSGRRRGRAIAGCPPLISRHQPVGEMPRLLLLRRRRCDGIDASRLAYDVVVNAAPTHPSQERRTDGVQIELGHDGG